jgi:hypothetical protein
MSKDEVTLIENHLYVSLKEHFQALLEGLDRRTEQTARDARAAVEKAEKAQERRLDLLNEFRAQAGDEAKKYALREAVDGRLSSVETQIARLYGGLVLLGFIGVANLVRVWLGH